MRSVNADTRLNVGLTFNCSSNPDDSIWANGAVQNVIFLYLLLAQSERIANVYLINCGDAESPSPGMLLDGLNLNIVRLENIIHTLDVLIEIGVKVGPETTDFLRNNGAKSVAYKVGNDYVMDVEGVIAKRQGPVFNGARFDAIWSIPQHMHTCRSYWQISERCPVVEVPHIWSSYFIEKIEPPDGHVFGYRPGKSSKRICIFEPNINAVKTCHYPMLICEEAYRQAPSLIKEIYVLNTFHLKDYANFTQFSTNLDIVQHKIASFEGRHITPLFMAIYGDIVVSHQWENALNYLYYDILFAGYPLIHNSEMIKDYGYYYESFSGEQGAQQLLLALTQHDRHMAAYNAQSMRLLTQVSVRNPRNIQRYEEALFNLFGQK